MNRCVSKHQDGRQCLLLQDHEGKHLISPRVFSFDAAVRVAEGWGFTGGAASAVVRGAFSAGPISSEKFVAMLKVAADAGLNRKKSW